MTTEEMKAMLAEMYPKPWEVSALDDGTLFVTRSVYGYIRVNPEGPATTPDSLRHEAACLRDDLAADVAGSVNA